MQKKLFYKNKIIFCFLLFSSNKFVEYLLFKLNNKFISKLVKKNKSNCFVIELLIELENYALLKQFLDFELKKEEFKFKFLYVIYNKNKMSTKYFEKNFIMIFDKKKNFENIFVCVFENLFFKNLFLLKIILFLTLNFVNLNKNLLKLLLLNVNNTSSS